MYQRLFMALLCLSIVCQTIRADSPKTLSIPDLVTYLGSPSGSPIICTRQPAEVRPVVMTEESAGEWVTAFTSDEVPEERWRACSSALLSSLPDAEAVWLLDAMGIGYRELLKSHAFERTKSFQDRALILQKLYIERREGLNPHQAIEEKLFRELRIAILKQRLGVMAAFFANDLISEFDLQHTIWKRHKISITDIDRIANDGDEATLMRISRRVPERDIRDEAKLRLIRLRMNKSVHLEIRNIAHIVEKQVLKDGVFSLSLKEHPIVSAWFDRDFLETHGFLVRQSPNADPPLTSLHIFKTQGSGRQILSRVDLKRVLHIEIQGFSHPVTLCSSVTSTDLLDPTPCISPGDVIIEHPLVTLHADGTLSLVERLDGTQLMKMARSKDGLVLPIRIGGQHLLTLSWKPHFQRPPNVVFTGAMPRQRGIDLYVQIDHRDSSLFLLSILAQGKVRRIVLDLLDATGFQIISQGAIGVPGLPGRDCEDCNCAESWAGGDGGDGGDGGNIDVSAVCGDTHCSHTLMVAQNIIRSVGGRGGAGGPAFASEDGRFLCNGRPALRGRDGASGRPGQVKFDVRSPGIDRDYED